ncbi:MAG: hypothetical protein GWP47_17060, partial [Actinobacteria bacterium]|nr:hypothetical protein [Actinomycetota bacterium]
MTNAPWVLDQAHSTMNQFDGLLRRDEVDFWQGMIVARWSELASDEMRRLTVMLGIDECFGVISTAIIDVCGKQRVGDQVTLGAASPDA